MSPSEKPVHILGISGSLRKASSNSGLLRAALAHLPDGVTLEIADISGLPLYNDDLWQGKSDDSELPEAVRAFRAQVAKANAFLFATNEYNYSVSGVLKNAIDWASTRPCLFTGKAATIVGAGGGMGTGRAQYHLRQIGVFLDLHFLNKPEVLVKRFEKADMFDAATGDLTDPKVEEYLATQVKALVAWSQKIQ